MAEPKAGGADPGKTDDPPKVEPKAPNREMPAEVVIPEGRHGKDITITGQKAVDLIKMGLASSQRNHELKEGEAALRSNTARFADYEKFRDAIDGNPTLRAAVAKALENPEAVIDPPRVNDPGDFGDPPPQQVDTQATRELATTMEAMRQEIAALRSSDQERLAVDAAKSRGASIEAEIRDYPWLKGKKEIEIVASQVRAEMVLDPNLSLSAAVAMSANDLRQAWEERTSTRVSGEPERRRLQTQTHGTPGVAPPKKYTKKDLADGSVLRAATEAASRFLGTDI